MRRGPPLLRSRASVGSIVAVLALAGSARAQEAAERLSFVDAVKRAIAQNPTARVADATFADVRRQVALAAARAYLAVIVQKHIVDSSTRARDTAKAHFDFAHSRLVGGVGNRIDEVRAAQELAADETQVQNAQTAL